MSSFKINSLDSLEKACMSFMEKQIVHDTAHDINHIKRVVANAKEIASQEDCDMWVVTAAAWLHDCVTFAKNDPNNNQSSKLAALSAISFLTELGFPEQKLSAVAHAIEAHSYSANIEATSIEAKVVQDADRLDGLGAVGIARCFAVSGKLGTALYHTEDAFCAQRTPNSKLSAVDHFYEKLFKTGKTMKTQQGKKMAESRVVFMQSYLHQLATEMA